MWQFGDNRAAGSFDCVAKTLRDPRVPRAVKTPQGVTVLGFPFRGAGGQASLARSLH
jgi:hypothetical protein